MKDKILDLCINIFAHNECDFEITLQGNGASSFEGSYVAWELLDILDVEYEEIEARVQKRIVELQDLYG